MPLTIGEIVAGGSLTAAFIAIGNWIRSVASRCCGFEKRLKALEDTVIEKGELIATHGTNLCAGEKKMTEMKVQLESLGKGISELHLLGVSTSGKIDALGEKIKTGINEVFLKLDPRLKSVEKQIEELEENDK